MIEERTEKEIQQRAIAVFLLFDLNPEGWPDLVQINRSGYTDANVRGIWTFEDRIEFANVPFGELKRPSSPSQGTSPESSGATG